MVRIDDYTEAKALTEKMEQSLPIKTSCTGIDEQRLKSLYVT